MPYLSIVPALRTPLGVDCFDYRIAESSPLQPGDLLRIPFRRRLIPGLVVSRQDTTGYQGRITPLETTSPILRLSTRLLPLLEKTAVQTFCSRPTILHSWLRTVPLRTAPLTPRAACPVRQPGKRDTRFVAHPEQHVIDIARAASGRILIVTPWLARADILARKLGCPILSATLPSGKAWSVWTHFLGHENGMLVTTKVGAWLSHAAHTVILDEPENDDHKQDERTPRVDARWLIATLGDLEPDINIFTIGLTPPLASSETNVAAITGDILYDITHPAGRSSFSHLTPRAVGIMEEALRMQRPVIVLHPIHGDRARMRCRDCGWQANCDFCAFPLSQESGQGRCHRCGRRHILPASCPSCGGSALQHASPGKQHLERELATLGTGHNIRVVDLSEWNQLSLPDHACVIVTHLSLLGGYSEDIRRQERLIIAWRRLASQVSACHGRLLVQGSETLLTQASGWLTPGGILDAWSAERAERKLFGYPPARQLVKFVVTDHVAKADELLQTFRDRLGVSWEMRGPFAVPFRSKTRAPRFIIHLLPPPSLSLNDILALLEPFGREGIIDLDPVAFFE